MFVRLVVVGVVCMYFERRAGNMKDSRYLPLSTQARLQSCKDNEKSSSYNALTHVRILIFFAYICKL